MCGIFGILQLDGSPAPTDALRRMGEPEDYAGIVAFLASSDAGFITGQTISVAGGMNMI